VELLTPLHEYAPDFTYGSSIAGEMWFVMVRKSMLSSSYKAAKGSDVALTYTFR
jgi:hypothetical protein